MLNILSHQARAACGWSQNWQGEGMVFTLPHVQLRLYCNDPHYLKLAKRALVTAPENPDLDQIDICLTTVSEMSGNGLADMDPRLQGLGAIINTCEANGVDGCYDSDFQSWQFFDPIGAKGVQILQRRGAIAPWERAFPLRNFLHWSAARRGARLIHAGTLGHNGHGVLLAGAGGAGKSGTVLSGVLHGLQSVGDDYVLLEQSGRQAVVKPLMRLMKQDARGLARLGLNPAKFGVINWQNKYEFDFDEVGPHSRAAALDMKAIFLPKIGTSAQSILRPASKREAMFALLPNNLQQLPGHSGQGMSAIAQLVRDLPAYHLDLSQDPSEIAATIQHFLSEAS